MTTRTRPTMHLSIAVMLSLAAFAAGGCSPDSNPIVPTPREGTAPIPTFTLVEGDTQFDIEVTRR